MTSSTTTTYASPPSFVTATGSALPPPPKSAVAGPYSQKKPDTLDKTVAFLAKRDGIDKVEDLQFCSDRAMLELPRTFSHCPLKCFSTVC